MSNLFEGLEPHVEIRVFNGLEAYEHKCRLAKRADGTPATHLEVYLCGMWCTVSLDDPSAMNGYDSWEPWC